MPRWEPHARQRLETAALELFASRGYDDTTVAEIAELAGVTPRTFFRHFTDKREALFGNADGLRDRIIGALREAPAGLGPLPACLHALQSCEEMFARRGRADLRHREAVIESSEELQEREARKLRSLSGDLAAELARRGAATSEAPMVADLAVLVLVHASRLWMRDPAPGFADVVDRAAAEVAGAFPAAG